MKKVLIFCLIISWLNAYSEIDKKFVLEQCNNAEYEKCSESIKNYMNDNSNLDWEFIEKIYLKLSEVPYPKAYGFLGNIYAYADTSPIKPSWEKSAKFYTLGCQLDDGLSCNNLALMYKLGIFYKKNYKKALALYTKACNNRAHIEEGGKGCENQKALLELIELYR